MNEIWNEKKIEAVEKYVHPKYQIILDTADPWEGKILSRKDFIERLHHSFEAFPDMHFEILSSIPEENHVGGTWILTGTNLGKINGYPPTNKPIRTTGMTIYYFNNNFISGHTQVFDRQLVAKQLGFL